MNRLNTENINGLVSIYADNLATAKFDADTSGNIYGTSLYINNQLINFGSYVTSSYLASNYALISSLSNYVSTSTLNSTLNNYATNNALGSYRLISDSFNKSDVTNEVLIRTGYAGLNSDGSYKTCKQYTDENIAAVSAATATNAAATTGVIASLAATNATVAVIEGEIATIQGELTTIDGQITTLEGKTQNQSATPANTSFNGTLQMTNGVNNNITLNQTGDISCLTETLNTLTCNTELKGNGKLNLTNATQDHTLIGNSITLSQAGKNTSIYGNSYIGASNSTVNLYGSSININNTNSITEFNTVTIGGLVQTVYLNGFVYINGKLVTTGFGTGGTNGQWSFPNI